MGPHVTTNCILQHLSLTLSPPITPRATPSPRHLEHPWPFCGRTKQIWLGMSQAGASGLDPMSLQLLWVSSGLWWVSGCPMAGGCQQTGHWQVGAAEMVVGGRGLLGRQGLEASLSSPSSKPSWHPVGSWALLCWA